MQKTIDEILRVSFKVGLIVVSILCLIKIIIVVLEGSSNDNSADEIKPNATYELLKENNQMLKEQGLEKIYKRKELSNELRCFNGVFSVNLANSLVCLWIKTIP
ncbi:hypothetical protein Q6A71_07390 [Helicobacter pylori]|uniref:hypothetical protein n=2 Tax=Helicobacter pylori TaxID=210 RepID=UPI002711E3C2|nr:hypothetical protein [Helicobacter pylori]MDO7817031.1 hypothetical protein [Helicobacter pylori]MDO7827761.1 hypothetical protein [Helicobacter pylori]